MTTTRGVTRRPGPQDPDLAASQRQAVGLSPAGRPDRAERAALDQPIDAATTHNVAIATHSNRPDLSHFLDTGQ
jgi:hypothetical protein